MIFNSLVKRDRWQNIINEKVIRAVKKIKMLNSTKDVGYAMVEERMRKKDGLESSVGWMDGMSHWEGEKWAEIWRNEWVSQADIWKSSSRQRKTGGINIPPQQFPKAAGMSADNGL